AKGATDDQIRQYAAQYLQHEDSLLTAAPSESTNATTPADPSGINPVNLLRAAGYGGSFHLGDELGITDPRKEAAFSAAHPIADALAQLAGAAVLPGAATMLIPKLATLAGVTAMGGATGALTGAGSGTDPKSRAVGALKGGAIGAPAAALGYGAQTLISKGLGRLLGNIAPNFAARRVVGESVKDLLSPAEGARVQARMDEINALAPGGSSPASAAVPQIGDKS